MLKTIDLGLVKARFDIQHEVKVVPPGKVETAAPPVLTPLEAAAAREQAYQWLARFAPLLDPVGALDASECRRRLEGTEKLRATAPDVVAALEAAGPNVDAELLWTFQEAQRQLDGIQDDLRERLGRLAPGDPAGRTDLTDLRSRLAERAAREELDAALPTSVMAEGPSLMLSTSPPNLGAAAGQGLFAIAWLAFTTFHATFMIGGAAKAFGFGALLLLAFYGLFWAVGIGTALSALRAAAAETVEFTGRRMTLRRRLFGIESVRDYSLGPESRAGLVPPAIREKGGVTKELMVRDERGREIRFGSGRPEAEQRETMRRINSYLQALRDR
jgi:hypothetical protein